MDIVLLDTETTGFKECRLVEIAWKKNAEPIRSFRVKAPIPIEEGATAVHGIKDEDLAALPLFAEHPEYQELKLLLEHSCVIAHNASFDIAVMQREGIFIPDVIDTKKISRLVYPHAPDHKLQTLRQYLQLDISGDAHSAGGDVAVLAALFDSMSATMVMNGTPEDSVLKEMALA